MKVGVFLLLTLVPPTCGPSLVGWGKVLPLDDKRALNFKASKKIFRVLKFLKPKPLSSLTVIIPLIVLAIVFVLIATRRIGNIRLQIWQVMLFGAIAVLVTGQISPVNALLSINSDVILFLFGMFIVGEALI